jgi:hypothetical protein
MHQAEQLLLSPSSPVARAGVRVFVSHVACTHAHAKSEQRPTIIIPSVTQTAVASRVGGAFLSLIRHESTLHAFMFIVLVPCVCSFDAKQC